MDSKDYRAKRKKEQEAKREIRRIFKIVKKKLEEKKVIRRKRIIKDYETLVLAAMLYIIRQLSFQRLSETMAEEYQIVMSNTSWKKQLTKLAPSLFAAMLEYVSNKSKEWSYCKTHKVLERFQAYILDTTKFSVEGGDGVAVQVHTQISVTDLSALYMSVTDCHTAESVSNFKIQEGRLYIADRAYGTTPQLLQLIKEKSNFIIRITPNHITLYRDNQCAKKVNWNKLLSNSSFSCSCFIKKKKEIFKLRLVGAMIPEEKHPDIEKRVCRNATKGQYQVTQQSLDYAKWVLLATTVPYVKSSDILSFYRLRWNIELFFKRAKTLLHFRKIPFSSPSLQISLVLLWVSLAIFISQISSLPSYSHMSPFNSFSLASSLCFSFFL